MTNEVGERKKLDELNQAISKIRGEASRNLEYGFEDDWYSFMSKMMLLTTQSQSPRIQNYIFRAKGWKKVPASLNKGDIKNEAGQYFEVKATIITSSNLSVNVVQIRLWQQVWGYYIFVIDAMNNFKTLQFTLSKADMERAVKLEGRSAHGTFEANKENKNKEWAIHFIWNASDPTYKRWIKEYAHEEFP